MKEGLSEAVIAVVGESLAGVEDIGGGRQRGTFMVARKSKAQTVGSRYLDERQAVGRLYCTSRATSPSPTT